MIDSIDYEDEWAVLRFSGVVTSEDMLKARDVVIYNSAFEKRKYHIWAFHDVEQIQLDLVAMEKIGHEDLMNYAKNPNLRVALVADTNAAFGMCRMYQGHTDDLWVMQVFRSFDEAQSWCQQESSAEG